MKKGYTLAETLVTLAVIGLLGAILIPVIRKSVPNKEMILYKKAYSLVQRVTQEMINDETLYPSADNNNLRDDVFMGFEDNRAVNFEGRQFGGPKKFCDIFAAKLGTNCNDDFTFTTPDGMFWQMPPVDFRARNLSITVDVDGQNRGENSVETAASQKPDRFRILVRRDGVVFHFQGPNAIEEIYWRENDTTKKYTELRRLR